MTFPYKIPKKTPGDRDSAHLHSSPLSRLQSSTPQVKGYGDSSSRGGATKVHAGNGWGSSSNRLSASYLPFRTVVKAVLGINESPSQSRERNESSANGWRPKRASDRLLPPSDTHKNSSGVKSPSRTISVDSLDSLDSLSVLRAPGHAGNSSVSEKKDSTDRKISSDKPLGKTWSSSGLEETREDETVCPSRTRTSDVLQSSSSSSSSSMKTLPSLRTSRRSLSPPEDLEEERMETQRGGGGRRRGGRTGGLNLPHKKPRTSEPIVLSSEEEEEEEEQIIDEDQKKSRTGVQSSPEKMKVVSDLNSSFLQIPFSSVHAGLMKTEANGPLMISDSGITLPLKGSEDGEDGEVSIVASELRGYGVWDGGVAGGGTLLQGRTGPAPSLLFLWVSDAQANLLHRELAAMLDPAAAGPSCVLLLVVLQQQLPEMQAGILASILDMDQYRLGRGGPAPSHRGPASPLDWAEGLVLVHNLGPPVDQHLLKLLGRSTQESSRPGLGLRTRSGLKPAGQGQLPTRLIQYPLQPCKGRISVSREDLVCLGDGQFLNDVIIDFYLKFLLLEGVSGPVADRSHVFSSFFFKQLSRRRAAGEGDAPSVPDRRTRHQRVKTWTRNVDIFTKDFLFVPVNQEFRSQWRFWFWRCWTYSLVLVLVLELLVLEMLDLLVLGSLFLVVVCFPGLEEVQKEDFQNPAGETLEGPDRAEAQVKDQNPRNLKPPGSIDGSILGSNAGSVSGSAGSNAGCVCRNVLSSGCQRKTVTKRPCILVMDSLKLSSHDNVCRLIRDYLQVEWEVRRTSSPRLFSSNAVRSSSCSVPQQDNSSDCGVYLLQYVETFLQNPVVNFDLPLNLHTWFPRQRVRQKREEIRTLILDLHRNQTRNQTRTRT
ncbi:sentrin-specific protease 7-like [Cololabis saira]|uniref:sentrin-specific protease 7-like n=1 Tax=Cololabis saira TaxID=129043 RepID=UPI002AD3BA70|nr:sentrin-specific protease 7-like [Cololabis saira]